MGEELFPKVEDAAPEVTVRDAAGEEVQLSSLWRERGVVLVFVRHLGCPLCRQHVVEMKKDYPRFQEAGLGVAVISMGSPTEAGRFRQQFGLPFECYSDEECAAYNAFHVRRGGLWETTGPVIWRVGLKAILRHGAGIPKGDVYRLAATFVIERGGKTVVAHRNRNSVDWLSVEGILGAVGGKG